jgi:hypothetical protein
MITISMRRDQRDCLVDCLTHLIQQARNRIERTDQAIDSVANKLAVSRLMEIKDLIGGLE